jgi:uncharacterized membrane protein
MLMELNKRTYLVLLSLVTLWCGGIVLAPVLKTVLPSISGFLYLLYAPICHQIDARSLHVVGEKLGVCARCSSIYFGFLVSLCIYPFVRELSRPSLPTRHWIALALVPMIADVILTYAGIHASSLMTRAFTGVLFGSIMPFYMVPPLLEGIAELRAQYLAQGGLFYARKTQ